MEDILDAEVTEHLGYEPHADPTSQQTNRRNWGDWQSAEGQ